MASFADSFDRGDNSDLGASWDPQKSGSQAQIVGQRVRVTSLSTNAEEVTNALTPSPDQIAQITIATFVGAGAGHLGVLLRAAALGAETFYLLEATKHSAGTSGISIVVAGAQTTLVSENATTWTAGDVLAGSVLGNLLTLKRNGVTLLQVSDATLGGGNIGIFLYEDTNAADTELDDFVGGDVAPTDPSPFACGTGV